VLSRFLVSRMLTLCRIPHFHSTKIAKDLKKKCVEGNKLQISQEEMNNFLFELMKIYGYGDAFSNRYKMLSKFYQNRVPLIILISGTIGLGKSIIATHLAERMNISNVLQTEIIELVMHKFDETYCSDNIKLKEYDSKDELLEEYRRRCRLVRRGANTDIQKALKEGKPLIIEGFSVDPRLYVKKLTASQEDQQDNNGEHAIITNGQTIVTCEENDAKKILLKDYLDNKKEVNISKTNLSLINSSNHLNDKFKIVTPGPENGEEKIKEKEREKLIRIEIEKIDQNSAVIVPILLVLDSKDHSYCIETKLNTIRDYEKLSIEDKLKKLNSMVRNYQIIQEDLINNSHLCTIIPVSINNHEETLELIQDIILDKIEAAYQRGDF